MKKLIKKRLRKRSQEEVILSYWELCGGKYYTDKSIKGKALVSEHIFNLLLDGALNPYIHVLEDTQHDLRLKGWTVKEIKQAIWCYTKVLKRKIDNLYFSDFVVTFRDKYKASRFKENRSFLVECHTYLLENPEALGEVLTSKSDTWLIEQLKDLRPDEKISEKAFQNVTKFVKLLESKNYEPWDKSANRLYHVHGLRVDILRYAKLQANKTNWKVNYMSGEVFEGDFMLWAKKNHVITTVDEKLKRVMHGMSEAEKVSFSEGLYRNKTGK